MCFEEEPKVSEYSSLPPSPGLSVDQEEAEPRDVPEVEALEPSLKEVNAATEEVVPETEGEGVKGQNVGAEGDGEATTC